MVEETVNNIVSHLNQQAEILLPEIDIPMEPVANSLEELAEVLGAVEVDPEEFERAEEPSNPTEPVGEEEVTEDLFEHEDEPIHYEREKPI